MKKGSITPFCAISLTLVASLLFVLLEASRVYGLDRYATLRAEAGIDSVCAEYQPFLWQQYGLLFLDGAYGTEQFSTGYVSERLENHLKENCDTTDWLEEWLGLDLFALTVDNLLLEGYALATDDEGELFLNYVAEREKENLPLGVAEDLCAMYQQADAMEEKYGGIEDSIAKAQRVLSEVKEAWFMEKEAERETPDTTILEEALSNARQMQNGGTLKMIFEDASSISQKISKLPSDLQARVKEEGTMHIATNKDWYRKILVLIYMEEYFANYTDPKAGHFLDYEMEYVICGKETEWENLAGALERLMLIREAANVAYLIQDQEKMALAEGLAELVGLMAGENPGVVKVIQAGIIGAWAYMESVLDVRTLVSGGLIPLVKADGEWTTELTNLFAVFDETAKAKACAEGLNYVDYLKQILFMTGNQKLAYRMMEVMEMGMQSQELYRNCRMDHMVVALRYKVQFESRPVFCELVTIGEIYRGNYFFLKEVERSYIP
ncbi:MAG: hypothetical protein IJZ23_11110 [Roseburia sp.]|nr:hypothetical protein [Roseburia sp.]